MKNRVKALLLALLLLGGALVGCIEDENSVPPPSTGEVSSYEESGPTVPQELEEYRGVWISYLEFESMDFSSESAFRAEIAAMFDECKAIGLNTVIVQVRPFGDALYPSEIFPWSHLVTGTQGVAPNYDPLLVMVEEAHERELRIEAWVNPYRVQLNVNKPQALAQSNPAVQNPTWAIEANGGLYYNPALPEVREFITQGVIEIVRSYDVDGIHFDDYFYPFPLDVPFDEYLLPNGESLAQWRRENVNQLIRQVYAAVKAENPNIEFGISPQGNMGNNYTQQYSDVEMWLASEGYVDYIMPQIYWGFGYTTSNGSEAYQFDTLVQAWSALPRNENVRLYIGLGAYRVGVGDGGSNPQDEWMSGHNIADMIEYMRQADVNGYTLYRYAHVFGQDEYALQEAEGIARLNGETN